MAENTILRSLVPQLSQQFFAGLVVVLLGPRQAGKSTMLGQILTGRNDALWLDAENADVARLFEKPTVTAMKNLVGKHKMVVIDEAQKIDGIGSAIKLMADYLKDVQAIATGSSSFSLRNQTKGPLTGRKWQHLLLPLSFEELVSHHVLLEKNATCRIAWCLAVTPMWLLHPAKSAAGYSYWPKATCTGIS